MSISYNNIGQVCVTCHNTSVQINQPCKVVSNCAVTTCSDGNAFDGVVVATRSNLATVVIRGFVTLSYLGGAPSLGYCPLASAGGSKVKTMEGAREYLVFHVDTSKKTVTFCL